MKLVVGAVLAAVLGVAAAEPPPGLREGAEAFKRGDFATAERLLLPLAKRGEAYAQAAVGVIYQTERVPGHDPREGMTWLKRAAAQGEPTAEFLLGSLIMEGGFGPRELNVALGWFRKAAQHPGPGAAEAQVRLGRLYAEGAAGAQGRAEAAKWLGLAADGFEARAAQGDLAAKQALATMYVRGDGLPQDPARAAQLYGEVAAEHARAAAGGDPGAQLRLADLYEHGVGVPADEAQAYLWRRRAADQGDQRALVRLSLFYARLKLGDPFSGKTGSTDPADEVQEYVWTSLAIARGGRREGASMGEFAAATWDRMTAAQRAEATASLQAWRATPEAGGAGPGPVTAAQAAELQRLAPVLAGRARGITPWPAPALAQSRRQIHEMTGRFGRDTPFATAPTRLKTRHLIPEAVLAEHTLLSVHLQCRVGPAGTLVDCRAEWESRPGIGLCDAALAVAPAVRLKERFPDGGPLEGLHATLQMMFDVGAKPPRIIPAAIHLWDGPISPLRPLDAQSGPSEPDCSAGPS